MPHFKSNVRDLRFVLFEVLELERTLATGAFGDLDADTVGEILEQVRRLAEGPLGASFAEADRNPPVFDPATHTVTLPEAFVRSFRAMTDGGWHQLGLPTELGGPGVPRAVFWAAAELILGAQPAAFFYGMAGAQMASVLYANGTEEQRGWARLGTAANWGGTMVLTEPDAGSDVGAGRTRAIRQEDGSWHIEGVKRFISNGDSGVLFPNMLHLVLARPDGAGPGTKGLSLFFVPQFHFDPVTGANGERNGVFVTGLEHKMGLRASTTCEVTFGGHGVPARGWLVGEVHNGIAQMFDVIEHARMMVGTKAIATLSTGYLHALEYAKQRVQGADLTTMADKSAPRVTIVHHPDVRRALMMQKAYAEGLRAIYLYTAAHQDPVLAEQVSGADPETAARVNDLLLPIVKGVGSERAYQYLTESLQTLGGSGYLQDYPIEQYIRDAKIDSLYEGTTAIQAQDFFFRKIIRDRGAALGHLVAQIQRTLDSRAGNGRLKRERVLLATALADVQAAAASLTGYLMGAQEDSTELYKVGLGSVRFLLAVGDLLIGWQLLHQAGVAVAALDAGADGDDRAFYEGKVAVAQFFARTVLPELTAVRAILATIDTEIMELDEAAF
ncbi:acyl-CoA dehydrogenase [Nocardia jiangsuensis]|uniref:Acyl-CoA dehydrogenase n=1 Tax=Nocardia jiangsuensis TaxID=1691563 RepID=A0ABV8DRZ6_9NOCA